MLVIDENLPRGSWPKGRIVRADQAPDGEVRLEIDEPRSSRYREIRALFITVVEQLGCQIFRASDRACCFAEIPNFGIPEIFAVARTDCFHFFW